jgi:hypothetical protein
MKTSYALSRRGPDRISKELATVLSVSGSYDFCGLFTLVYGGLKASNDASGGEEMLRLRTYEKLQNFVQSGVVKKTGKQYEGHPVGLPKYLAQVAEQQTQAEARRVAQKATEVAV